MRATSTDPNCAVSRETILLFDRKRDLISAHYLGGTIADGYLIGKQVSATSIRFCYVQVDLHGAVDAGTSVGTIERLQDGRFRLIEAFQWFTRFGGGTNVFEEIP
jgi:hypothetical protein